VVESSSGECFPLAEVTAPEEGRRLKTLDDWCAAFGVDNARRHDALADAIATG